MFSTELMLILCPALPLAAAVATAVLGPRVLRGSSHWPTILGIGGSFVAALVLLMTVGRALPHAGVGHSPAAAGSDRSNPLGFEKIVTLWTWVDVKDAYGGPIAIARVAGAREGQATNHDPAASRLPFRIDVVLRLDPLTALMLITVNFVALLVAVYSCGYMRGDPGYGRFFAYVSLFVFSMNMLVTASNFVVLYVFWEAVGACSYLLIGFWYTRPAAAAAGKKAFLVNRVGDFCFMLALFVIWLSYGTLNFHDSATGAGVLGQQRLAAMDLVGGGVGLAICLLLLSGACGKSAQFPLHVWLADAMEGPTPVSALIHAATMVTAGVYLVARCTPLFWAAPTAQHVVACIGAGTAMMAALIAVTQFDLKRVLAYSTISQLGYMFLGLGVGTFAGITSGMFHLFTHAFFKALLFLGAGSVMHAMGGVIDMRKLGGLRRIMPVTHWTFAVGCLALAGIVPFSGFWSKDAILAAVRDQGESQVLYQWLYGIGLAAAFLTSVYTFRAFYLTFYGPLQVPPEAGHHAHESPASMCMPLALLAAFAAGIGWLVHSGHAVVRYLPEHVWQHFLQYTPSLAMAPLHESPAGEGSHFVVAMVSTIIALSGLALASFLYLGPLWEAEWLAKCFSSPWLGSPYQFAKHKFFIDEIYDVLVVRPMRALASLAYFLDQHLVDGMVDWFGRLPRHLGDMTRRLQQGLTPRYGLVMILGFLVLLGMAWYWN